MAVPKANQRAVNKYVKNNYDRINVTMPKGKKETIQTAAAAAGESVNAYINTAITQRMEREAAGATLDSRGVSLPSETEKPAVGRTEGQETKGGKANE